MNIVKRIFGALFLLGGIGCFVIAWMAFSDGNKHDALSWAGAGGGAFFFSLVFFGTSFGKSSTANASFPQQFQQPQGYPQQQQQGYPRQQQQYPQQQQRQQPPPPYPGPPYPPRT